MQVKLLQQYFELIQNMYCFLAPLFCNKHIKTRNNKSTSHLAKEKYECKLTTSKLILT
jgi:hypothetical protein